MLWGSLLYRKALKELNSGEMQLISVPDLVNNEVVWQVHVPSTNDYTGPVMDSMSVQIVGTDGNTNQPVYSNTIQGKRLYLQLQPRIKMIAEILEPHSARDAGRISHGQSLKVRVWAEFVDKLVATELEYANIEGTGTIKLDDKLFSEEYGFKKIARRGL